MVTFITAIGRMTISIPVVLTSIAPPATGNGTVVRDTSSATIANGNSRVLDSGGGRHNDERPMILGNTFAMKRWIAITLLLLVPAEARAGTNNNRVIAIHLFIAKVFPRIIGRSSLCRPPPESKTLLFPFAIVADEVSRTTVPLPVAGGAIEVRTTGIEIVIRPMAVINVTIGPGILCFGSSRSDRNHCQQCRRRDESHQELFHDDRLNDFSFYS